MRYEEIDRRHKAGKGLSEEDRLFHADYEAEQAAKAAKKQAAKAAKANLSTLASTFIGSLTASELEGDLTQAIIQAWLDDNSTHAHVVRLLKQFETLTELCAKVMPSIERAAKANLKAQAEKQWAEGRRQKLAEINFPFSHVSRAEEMDEVEEVEEV